jgi:hypothetical protein
MADTRAFNRGRGRARIIALKGGRGGPRGGRNAVELHPPREGGSPIASHMSTLHDANSTTDDTIDIFVQVRPLHKAFHSITVRQRHVENICGGLNSQIYTKILYMVYTTFTPDSVTEQRQKFLSHNNNLNLQNFDTKNFLHERNTNNFL